MRNWIDHFKRRWLTWGIVLVWISLSILGFEHQVLPGVGQPLPMGQLPASLTPEAGVFQDGTAEYAYLELDGIQLFPLAATLPSDAEQLTSPARQRVQKVEMALNQLIRTGFDPAALRVIPAQLNQQTVLLVVDPSRSFEQSILTVTDLDAQLAQQPIPALAQQWANKLQAALLNAHQERQPVARKTQILRALEIGLLLVLTSLMMALAQKRLRKQVEQFQHLSELVQFTKSSDSEFEPSQTVAQHRERSNARLRWQQQRGGFLATRLLLQLAQSVIWLGGIAWILHQFPETRDKSSWLIDFPLQILLIWIVLFAAVRLVRFFVNRNLQAWVERTSLISHDFQRIALRAPTLAEVIGNMINLLACVIGVIWFLNWHRVSFAALTSAGLVGVALSFVFQNLLKDWVNGLLIVIEDQYVVSDLVEIGNRRGKVEHMTLRTTQLRGENGSIDLIPHNQVGIVRNFTKDWSRVDFVIQVAYQTDIDLALRTMKEVAESMYNDPNWQDEVLESAAAVSVSDLAASGVELMMQMKTKRARQTRVEQEFRYRLKLAFDQQGIQLA